MKKKNWKGAHHPLKWVIWSLAVAFLFYEYFIRVTPSVIVPDLMESFNINAAEVGLLSSFYLYAYGAMQIPVGSLSDRFGARRLLTFGCLFCALGSFLFGWATSLALAEIGRFFIGFGSAVGFIAVIYVSTHWFPQNRWALLIGIGNSLGMLGAFCGQGPLSYAIEAWTWRPVVIGLAVIGTVLGVVIYLVVRNDPKGVQKTEKETITLSKSLAIVSKNPKTWFIALASGCYYSSLLAFGALWGIPFLKSVHGLSTSMASFATSMIYLGFVFGGPVIGYLSDHLSHRKPLLLIFVSLTICALSPLIYISKIPVIGIFILLLMSGIFASGQLLTYTFAIESNPIGVKATSVGFVNAMVFAVGSIMQPLIGFFLDLYWSHQMSQGARVYSPENYKVALSWFPALLVLSFVLLLFVRESKHHVKGVYEATGL